MRNPHCIRCRLGHLITALGKLRLGMSDAEREPKVVVVRVSNAMRARGTEEIIA